MASTILADNGVVSGSAGIKQSADSSGVLALASGTGTTAITIDASQNVGIGTTSPSAPLAIGRVNAVNEGGQIDLCRSTDNASAWGIDVYGNTSTPSLRFIDNVASATRMAIDGSGNVGIGTSSPSYKIDAVIPTLGNTAGNTSSGLRLTTSTGNTDQLEMFYTRTSSVSGWPYADLTIRRNVDSSGGQGYMTFGGANSVQFGTNSAERMRIDSSGNLLVGTTTPAASSTNTIVGTTTGGNLALAVIHNASNNSVRGILSKSPNFSGNDGYLMIGARSTGDVAYMFTNGNWTNLNNSYGALSDIKLKENIADATPKLEKLNQVRVVTYNLKSDPSQKQIGVIAQELEQVFPSMVEESTDRDQEGVELETKTKYVKYSVFVPILIKAIQEQQALITTLTERITALEAK